MKVTPTALPDVLLIEPRVHTDERGFFLESYNSAGYMENGLQLEFVQDNHSRSTHGVLRGLHFQTDTPQGKLVRVASGGSSMSPSTCAGNHRALVSGSVST